jgi:hypothetical protein
MTNADQQPTEYYTVQKSVNDFSVTPVNGVLKLYKNVSIS